MVHYERLINVKNVKGLSEVASDNGTIRIGALCTHHQLETSSLLQQKLAALVQLEQNVANVRVRQVGTLGGNLCFAEPHADPGTLLMAHGSYDGCGEIWLKARNSRGAIFSLTPMKQV